MIQPYYIIKNVDEATSFAVTQADLLDFKISIKPLTAMAFNWPDKDSEESLVLALVESASNTLQTDWSRKFKIDLPGQFVVKCFKAGTATYVTVNVYHEENSPYYITLCKATKENLPLKIVNETKYEMKISQVFLDKKKKLLTNVQMGDVITINPCSYKMYAWDENCPPRYLRVQVDESEKIYEMDSVKDLEPLILKGVTNKEHREIKHYLRGYLKRRNIYDDRDNYREEYCILNFSKQTLKIYPNESYATVVRLQNAQIARFSGASVVAIIDINPSRLEIARCLVCEPLLILLDEPFAALGVEQTRRGLDMIRHVASQGIGVIIITHIMQQAFQVADRIVVIRQGVVAGDVATSQTTPDAVIRMITGETFAGAGAANRQQRQSGEE